MVHGLNVLRRLNDEAVRQARGRKPEQRVKLPDGVGLSPVDLRRYTNRPWTKEELGGQPCVYESYARSSAAPFGGKCQVEGPRA